MAGTFCEKQNFLMPEDGVAFRNRSLPEWFRQDIPDMDKIREMKRLFRAVNIHTVCESARCPNMGKCWGNGTATFMILGDVCTRACRFCAVKSGMPAAIDPEEPRNVALAVKKLNLKYVVITSVSRDDLADGGAQQFVDTIDGIRKDNPLVKIEILIPDFLGKPGALSKIIDAGTEVIGHNIETVPSLFQMARPQAGYETSLELLRNLKKIAQLSFIKSGFMVGLGESDDEVSCLMQDLLNAGCDILTIGQYLFPGQPGRHINVRRFVPVEQFDFYKHQGLKMGFKSILSGPLVRSSFDAGQAYEDCRRVQ